MENEADRLNTTEIDARSHNGQEGKWWRILDRIDVRIMPGITDEAKKTISQAVGFAVVGLSNTVISYVLYTGALLFLRSLGSSAAWDYLAAQLFAFVLSVLWSYYLNSRYVFETRGWQSLLKTFASYSVTGLFLSAALLILWVQVLHMSEFVAPILNLLITVPLNFVLNKFWAFKSE